MGHFHSFTSYRSVLYNHSGMDLEPQDEDNGGNSGHLAPKLHEMLHQIMSYLPTPDLQTVTLVSRGWEEAAHTSFPAHLSPSPRKICPHTWSQPMPARTTTNVFTLISISIIPTLKSPKCWKLSSPQRPRPLPSCGSNTSLTE
ncbi:uncharacterized protein LOC118436805 [Folsomia candida]|uniref:uncharacterized protein LOC118436805 n=1 Tax=Folsomia candida TaxID=158441 RepID=UPI001604D3CB|nr:uncharacterized protein LOC118436805 [Folsomia candida]